MRTLEIILLGLVQGATELFPVSSLGHAVLVPSIFRWSIQESDPTFLPYLVLLHLGTAAALLWLYRGEWVRLVRSFARAAIRGRIVSTDERLSFLIVVATVPAGVVGVFAESAIRTLFATPRLAAVFLIVNGGMLYGAELLRRRAERRSHLAERSRDEQELAFETIGDVRWRTAVLVGACQALALLPGISRSGVTMAAGLVSGLRHEEAAHFSFLLATPAILAAGALEVPSLAGSDAPLGTYAVGGAVAAVAAYVSARFLLRYFRSGRLDPYAAYCAVAGAVALLILR